MKLKQQEPNQIKLQAAKRAPAHGDLEEHVEREQPEGHLAATGRPHHMEGWDAVLHCFSLKRNMKSLLGPAREGSVAYDTLSCLPGWRSLHPAHLLNLLPICTTGPFAAFDGVRVISMLWIIWGHGWMYGARIGGFSNYGAAR